MPNLDIYIFFIHHVCESTCPHQPPTRGDNSFGSSRRYCHSRHYQAAFATGQGIKGVCVCACIYIYIYMPDQLKKTKKKKRINFRRLMLLRIYSNCFLSNHTGKVVPCIYPSCWKLTFDQVFLSNTNYLYIAVQFQINNNNP